MDKILFLSFCLSNALLYSLIRYFYLNFPGYATLEIMAYVNIGSLFFFIPYFIISFKKVASLFVSNLRLFLIAPASALKIFSLQYISVKNAMVVSFLTPAAVVFLSFITLNEYNKKYTKKYLWLFASFIGVVVFVGVEFRDRSYIYMLLLMYVLMKSLINIFLKQLSKDRYVALFYTVLHYAFFGMIVLIWMGKFELKMFFNWRLIGIGLLSVVSQLALIKSYEIAPRISLLQNLDYSRMIFSCIIGYFLFGEIMTSNQVVGVAIIIVSIILSNSNELGMKKYNILVLGLKDKYFYYSNRRKIKNRYELRKKNRANNLRSRSGEAANNELTRKSGKS